MLDKPYQHMLAGEQYVAQITASKADQLARAKFLRLVLKIAPPGGMLFDFGAGPGIDVRFLAERGFRIDAYDIDPRMCDFFADYCRDVIQSGQVTLHRGDYGEFIAGTTARGRTRADLIISNFAPLNLVDDVRELFRAFHELTNSRGKILVSVLNPYFLGDMRFRWWWRNAPPLWRNGEFLMPGPQAPHIRRRTSNWAAMGAPYFSLRRIYRGLPGPGPRATARFSFLLFERLSEPEPS